MCSPVNWRKWLMLSVVGLALSVQPIGCYYNSITERFGADAVAQCNEKCPFQNTTGDVHFDLNCGPDCSIQQCRLGCNFWRQGLDTSCQTICNATSDTVVSRELYCVMGCNEALNIYYQMLKDFIGIPPAPALVADSLTPTSLSLVWEPPPLVNLTYMLQWCYEDQPGTWQFSYNDSRVDGSIVHVWNLTPYTKYRFRIAILVGGGGECVWSRESVVISSAEGGPPSSAVSVRGAAPAPRAVAVSWTAGPFLNGPLVSYVLRITDTDHHPYQAVKDIPALNNTMFYMFQNLEPSHEYVVSVSMRNAFGEGPRAYVTLTTPPLPTSTPEQPILVLGGEHMVLAAPANDMLFGLQELYTTEHNITGVALDISNDYLFISVSNGFVYRSTLSKMGEAVPILTPNNISFKPLDLSVDWLNRHIYILGEVFYSKPGSAGEAIVYSNWEILRCDYDGKNHLVALSGFNSRPIHFEVDPYNGYIFWCMGGGGLYRVDLAHVCNGVRHETPPELVVRDAHLAGFTLDHADFRLLVAHLTRNNILAVSLDGREIVDFRSNTQTPMFMSARSIAYANGLFYWTNGKEMLSEEYHAQTDSYFHNEYPLAYNMTEVVIKQVTVNLRSCQPVPVPVNPPISVQSIMGIDLAKVTWQPPHLLGHQGKGAWQKWRYRLQLLNTDTQEIIYIDNINGTSYVAYNLKPNTEYVIKAAAVTTSGIGPWSSEFVSKTLPATVSTHKSLLIWSGPDGLFQTNLTGDSMRTLIERSQLKDTLITDMSWYKDLLYLVTNASNVMWYNMTSREHGLLPNMDNVGGLAVDWVGKRIYWSNPKQQLITRGALDGSNREPVPIVTVARELAIDSLEAYIYWNTGHAVEAARLNGENKMVYYPAQLFSGKQVMGIATDLQNKWLYWLVRNYDGTELHRAPTAEKLAHGYQVADTLVGRLSGGWSESVRVWGAGAGRAGRGQAALCDVTARYDAALPHRAYALLHLDPTTQQLADHLVAIPESVDPSSISITGAWDDFNVTWAPSRRVNVHNARVYYDVSLNFKNNLTIERTVYEPCVRVSGGGAEAYSTVTVRVRALTHWGGGADTRVLTRTPPHAPPSPDTPRAFTHHHTRGVGLVEFRWSGPERWRGVAGGYDAVTWTSASPRPRPAAAPLSPHTNSLLLPAPQHDTLYFKVRAYNAAGYGNYSEIVSISPNDINPVPRVMISSEESIKIVDLDSGDTETVPKSTGIPIDFGISIEENIVYWVNNLEEIFSSRVNGSSHYKVTSINNTASSACVDWVGRSVYWSQIESDGQYVTYAADLASYNTRPRIRRLFETNKPPLNMQVVPLEGSLYWYEESNHRSLGALMTSNLDGSDIKRFFNNTHRNEDHDSKCNCPENPQVAKTFAIDMTRKHIEIYWVDPWTHNIIATDINSCKCRTVIAAIQKNNHGFIPDSITVDSKYIYWLNASEKIIYYTNKNKKQKIEHFKTFHGYKIIALDPASQAYPPSHCLFPEKVNVETNTILNSTNSITLLLPIIGKPKNCSHIKYKMSAIEYTIFYRKYDKDTSDCSTETCQSVTTSDNQITIYGLEPFTKYLVSVHVTNYYFKLYEQKPFRGENMVLQTAAEAPAPPENVSAEVLSPVLCRVTWKPVPGLSYQLHWQTNDLQLKEHKMLEVSSGGEAYMSRLSPHTRYEAWVRAVSPHAVNAADSPHVPLQTAPLPPLPAAVAHRPYEITLLWEQPHQLHNSSIEWSEVAEVVSWFPCVRGGGGEWAARGLRPRTRYAFRLRLHYTPNAPPYYYPPDQRLMAETTSDVPSAPSGVWSERVGERVVRVRWTEPAPRGDRVDHYRLWGRPATKSDDTDINNTSSTTLLPTDKLPDDLDEQFREMIQQEGLALLHNCTETSWVVEWWGGADRGEYEVCVQGHNAAGWGPLSAPAPLSAPPALAPPPALLLAASLAATLLAVVLTLLYMYKRRKSKKPDADTFITASTTRRGPDIELAALRELPIRHSNNVIYNQGVMSPSEAEIAALPRIRREQISLNKFLGAGAFGEVFQGVARDLLPQTTVSVAVKTLRKGATDQEKSEFLQEAALMANFKHEHILRLYGVCLDNDPHYIIMELMEEGDLLTYLRTKRTSLYTSSSLTLVDLLNMCVDVTKGCRYLEEMHFVHRDLAARNCLVAHRAGTTIVKIGDFGLARDIYRNDYYRKEGEGLMPVRWMAVESLVDGVFSAQSDVWAWAVLCWEVFSLGHQPYPGRTNRQVLIYVRHRGTPDRPPNCPNEMYELLKRCWSYSPEARPTFRECLEVVTSLRDATSPQVSLTATAVAAPPHYITVLPDDAVDNRTYLLDENENACIDDEFPDIMEPSRTLPERTPKYLELMYDPDCVSETTCDGYEIPRTSFGSSRSCMPTRHSIIGIAPNRLIKPQIYRSQSLRTNMRPTATITPLRNGINKRASLCESLNVDTFQSDDASTSIRTNDDDLVKPL